MSVNPLLDLIQGGLPHIIHKWMHYLPLYHRHFEKYKLKASPTTKVKILEIGVSHGGSLDLWNAYFGSDRCEIYGIDIVSECKRLERDNIKIFIGDQGDKVCLATLLKLLPSFDIIIDDGGHRMHEQINSFEAFFAQLNPGGVYLCEDTHTSYWPTYGGGLKNPNSFMEYTKGLIDKLNAYHCRLPVDAFVTHCLGITCYDSMVFFEKAEEPIIPPTHKIFPAK